MTRSDNRIKKDARARAAETGEPYSVARLRVVERAPLPPDEDRARLEELAHLDCTGAYDAPVPEGATGAHRKALDRVAMIGHQRFGYVSPRSTRRVLPDSTDIVEAEIQAVLIDAGGYPLYGDEVVDILLARERLVGHRVRGVSDLITIGQTLRTGDAVAEAVNMTLDLLCGSTLICGFHTSGHPFLGWLYTCSLESRSLFDDLRTLRATDWNARYGALWEESEELPELRRLPRPPRYLQVGGTRCHPAPVIAHLVR